jgi:hypothetical protein
LSQEKIDQLFNEGKHSMEAFAGRLLVQYFTTEELSRNANVLGNIGSRQKDRRFPKEKLDPTRIEMIKKHIIKQNGGENEAMWQRCITRMNVIINRVNKECGTTALAQSPIGQQTTPNAIKN